MKKMARVFYAIGLILVFFVGCGASNGDRADYATGRETFLYPWLWR